MATSLFCQAYAKCSGTLWKYYHYLLQGDESEARCAVDGAKLASIKTAAAENCFKQFAAAGLKVPVWVAKHTSETPETACALAWSHNATYEEHPCQAEPGFTFMCSKGKVPF